MTGATRLPTGDTKHWVTYRVEVGDEIVQFTIPPRESIDFPEFDIPRQIDLAQPGLFNKAELGPALLRRFWDYRTSRFAQVDGTLSANILLWHSEKVLDDARALEAALKESAALQQMMDVLRGGRGGPPDDPTRFEPAIVGGKQGLFVHYQASSPDYAVPLDAHHYLTIYVDGKGVTRPGWREDARAAADAILSSIRIEAKR